MGNIFLPNNSEGIPALIVIPTRLDVGFFNALCCGMGPQTNSTVSLASSKPVQHDGDLLEQVAKTANPPSKSGGRSGPATEGQIKFMKSIAKKKGLREADICKDFAVKNFSDLTNQQASDWLEEHNVPDPW